MHSSRMRTGCSLTVRCSLPRGGLCSWGISTLGEGVSAPRGCLLMGGVCSQGVSALGGVCSWGSALGGVYSEGGVCYGGESAPGGVYPSMHWGRHPPPQGQNSWHTLVKILPWPNFVAAGNNLLSDYLLMWVRVSTAITTLTSVILCLKVLIASNCQHSFYNVSAYVKFPQKLTMNFLITDDICSNLKLGRKKNWI